MRQIILFDLDGTLIDSTPAIYESFCAAFKAFNFALPSFEAIYTQIGHPLDIMFESLGVESAKIPALVTAYKEHYQKICKAKTTLLPNAKEAVLEAKEFAHLGVVTTKTGQYSKMLLEHLGLCCFTCVIGREDVKFPKPNPEPIFKALEVLPTFEKSKITMIGDTPLDIQAANAAGISSIAVLSGYASLDILQHYTQNISKDVLEAVRKLKYS